MAGKVTSYATYDDWGELTAKAIVKMGVRMLDLVQEYTGHAYDQVLDLYYAKARMYDAHDRRFVAVDWVPGDIRKTQSLTQYVYCHNNPIVFWDPLGLYVKKGDFSDTVILPNGNKEHLNDTTYADMGFVYIREIIDILTLNGKSSKVSYDKATRTVSGYTTSYLGQVNFSLKNDPMKIVMGNTNKAGNIPLGYFLVLSCSDKTYVELKFFARAAGFGIGLRFYIQGTIGADGLLPTSGSEPNWEPQEWQGDTNEDTRIFYGEYSSMGDICFSTNCYAYALDLKYDPFSNQLFNPSSPQPGSLSSGEYNHKTSVDIPKPITDDNLQQAIKVIFEAARQDAWAYGNDFARSDRWEQAPAGMYKVALALSSTDYHWYRQDSNGLWSHKQSTNPVSENRFTDPETAKIGNYKTFGDYYITGKPW